jgi:PAS domain S-box-containing protein
MVPWEQGVMTKSGFFLTSSFLDDLDVAFYVIDVSTSELLHVSAAAARIAGTAPGSGPLEMAMAGVIHEDDRPRVFACVAGLLEGGPPVASQYRVLRTDGSVRVVAARTVRAQLPDGRDVIIGQLTDLTDHLESERERLGHELTKRRLEALIDGIADAAIVLDRDFRVMAMNQAASRATMLHRSMLLGQRAPDVVPMAPDIITAVNEVFASGQSRTVVYRSLGSRRRLEVTVAPLEGMVALMARDIEDALREQERFRTIVETQQEAVCVAAPDTTVRYANSALLRMVGDRGAIGVRWIDHIPADERERLLAHLQSLSPECPTRTIEYEQHTPFGRRVFQWCDTMIFNELGVAQELIGVGRDVTEARARIAEQNAALMERELLLRELHHGVKNNLQIVTSMVRLRLDALNDPRAIAIGREIEERVRVMGLIHDLLNAAADPGLVDVNHLLTELVHLILQVHGRPDVHVVTSARVLPLRVDRAMNVSRAVHELLCNALKHAFPASDSHGSGHIDGDGMCACGCVLPHRVSITLNAEGEAVVLEVEDNGRGLPLKSRGQKGRRSWGLQIIDSIAQQQGGTFSVGSGADGRGVRARLTLPDGGE